MTRHNPTTNRTKPPYGRPTPPVWLALLMAAAVPAAVYLLTHPLAAVLVVGVAAGRLSRPLAARLRAALGRVLNARPRRTRRLPTVARD